MGSSLQHWPAIGDVQNVYTSQWCDTDLSWNSLLCTMQPPVHQALNNGPDEPHPAAQLLSLQHNLPGTSPQFTVNLSLSELRGKKIFKSRKEENSWGQLFWSSKPEHYFIAEVWYTNSVVVKCAKHGVRNTMQCTKHHEMYSNLEYATPFNPRNTRVGNTIQCTQDQSTQYQCRTPRDVRNTRMWNTS